MTDHFFLSSKLSLSIRLPARRRAAKKRLNCAVLKENEKLEELGAALTVRLHYRTPDNFEECWDASPRV